MQKKMKKQEFVPLRQMLLVSILKEQESITLYKSMRTKAHTQLLKNLFDKLLTQEISHENFYTSLIEEITSDHHKKTNEENEYTIYMMNMLEEHKKSFDLQTNYFKSTEEALNYALLREKHSILFYTGLQYYVPEIIKPRVRLVIKQEIQHAEWIRDIKKHPKFFHQ